MTYYLTNYAYFTNKFDLDRAASSHRAEHWQAMNDTDRAVLDVIRQYSVKYGAAHLKHDTIAAAIGKSNITARRAVRKLVELKIIEKTHYVRPVMNGLGANIYAVLPFEDPKKPEKTEVVRGEKVEKAVVKEAQKDMKISPIVEQQAAPTTYFGRMKAFLASTIGDAKLARNFFGVYRKLTIPMLKFSIHADRGEEFEALGIRALQIAVQATKRKNIRNLPGYYSGVLRKLIDQALFSDAFMEYTMPPVDFYVPER